MSISQFNATLFTPATLVTDDISVPMNEFYGIYEENPPTVQCGKAFFATENVFVPKIGDLIAELAEDRSFVYR